MDGSSATQELGKRRALPIMIENSRPAKRLRPSSSTEGFFQSMPKVENQSLEDAALRRASKLFLPADLRARVMPELSRFGDFVLSEDVFKLVEDAEKHEPYIRTWNSFGERVDELVTSEGWRKLQDIGIQEGIVATGYERPECPGDVVAADSTSHADDQRYARVCQFLRFHLWTGSCANVTCPSAMQDGAARLLANQLRRNGEAGGTFLTPEEESVFKTAYHHLTSRDPQQCWTSGQWMTERTGGSDVRSTETLATVADEALSATDAEGTPLGPWRIDGFKWFSSATDSQMAVLLGKTEDGNISTFFAPTRRMNAQKQTELNGIQLQRLKSKLGTHPLPTAELVLSGMRAWRVGQEGAGTKEISAVLNITRLYTAMGSVGCWGRGLAISRAFARTRKVAGGRRLRDVEAHVRTMAENHVKYRARMLLAFFVASLMGSVEYSSSSTSSSPSTAPSHSSSQHQSDPQSPTSPTVIHPSQPLAAQLFRLLTPLAKAVCSKDAVSGLQECMESMGGVGYLENEDQEINVARLFRDANVMPIWEGTTDVLGSDIVRVLKQNPSPPPAPAATPAQNHNTDGMGLRDAVGRWIEGEGSTSDLTSEIRSSANTANPNPNANANGSKPFASRPTDAPALTAFATWVTTALCTWQSASAAIPHAGDVIMLVAKATRTLLDKIRACGAEQLRYEARDVAWRLAWVVCAVLLVEDARHGDGNSSGDEVAWKVALRWVLEHNSRGENGHRDGGPDGVGGVDADWQERSRWDRKIVFDAGDRMGLDAGKARL